MNKLKKYIRWWKVGIQIVFPALFYVLGIFAISFIAFIAFSLLPKELQAVGIFVVVGLGIFPIVFGYLNEWCEELQCEKPPWM